MKLPPYRTVGIAALGILAALAGLAFCGHWPAASGSYPAFCGCIGACVAAVAAKSFGQHKANAEATVPGQPAATATTPGAQP